MNECSITKIISEIEKEFLDLKETFMVSFRAKYVKTQKPWPVPVHRPVRNSRPVPDRTWPVTDRYWFHLWCGVFQMIRTVFRKYSLKLYNKNIDVHLLFYHIFEEREWDKQRRKRNNSEITDWLMNHKGELFIDRRRRER